MDNKINSQYSFENGDFDTSDIRMKLTEDIDNYICSPKMRGGYGSNYNYLDKSDEGTKSYIIKDLEDFIFNLNNVVSITVTAEETSHKEGFKVLRFLCHLVYSISKSENESIILPIRIVGN